MGIAEAVEVYNKVADAINAQALKLFEIIFIWECPCCHCHRTDAI